MFIKSAEWCEYGEFARKRKGCIEKVNDESA